MKQTRQQLTVAMIAKPRIHVILTQMSIKEGIKNFRDKGYDALL